MYDKRVSAAIEEDDFINDEKLWMDVIGGNQCIYLFLSFFSIKAEVIFKIIRKKMKNCKKVRGKKLFGDKVSCIHSRVWELLLFPRSCG
jgi:hypothetical protein